MRFELDKARAVLLEQDDTYDNDTKRVWEFGSATFTISDMKADKKSPHTHSESLTPLVLTVWCTLNQMFFSDNKHCVTNTVGMSSQRSLEQISRCRSLSKAFLLLQAGLEPNEDLLSLIWRWLA